MDEHVFKSRVESLEKELEQTLEELKTKGQMVKSLTDEIKQT